MADSLMASRCPTCLQTKPGTTSAALSSGDVWEDVPDPEIERKIEHIESLISRLFRERTRLYRKRNEIRSPIYSLPPEILAHIFKFACPSLDFPQMYGLNSLTPGKATYPDIINVLSAVSTHWHNIVLSMPSLWTSFVADDRNINTMQTVLSRSEDLLVAASLDFPVQSVPHISHTAVIAPVLAEYASRIRMLHVRNASPTWLKDHIPSFVNLELLCLQGDERQDERALIDSSCTRLVLKDFPCRISLSWSTIEVLHLVYIPIHICLEMLEKCTHLIEFRLRDPPFNSSIDGIRLPSSPFILPRLKVFEWPVDDQHPVDRAMLQYTCLPALQTLVLFEEDIDVRSSGCLSTFFKHFSSTLSAMQIQNGHCEHSVTSYFSKFSNVKSLDLKGCDSDFVNQVFNNLAWEICLVGDQEMPMLPNLKSIYINSLTSDHDQAKVLQTFRRSYSQPSESSIHSSLGSPFRIEFAEYKVDWTPEFKEELIKMVESGYQVELWEDSKPVEWLPR
ncbi:hypothetical protein AGABI2DRAFT_123017 [Agaricus bisporus var. bisporus H97]|uniref:hypothetical protein n=1 Tax=Agaricus bisporus var. bisporus (strain H97 / ATCC MYA-4626 / FGSC 10389) TaxID=936046 RepID=UPI00029F6453|nr:hypothetical protein AGABI2DRAFT_123017 [Agaricus bisporus var. bisporus H97]EKV42296.1 hypothetical protein AGABI2DRAFT_123017 [Agaricus bisporus var. bisporus H97]